MQIALRCKPIGRGLASILLAALLVLIALLSAPDRASAVGGPFDWSEPKSALHSPPFGGGHTIAKPSCRVYSGTPACIAASESHVAFSSHPFALQPEWDRIPTPSDSYIYAADCASLTACVAVGYPSIVSTNNITAGSPAWATATFGSPDLNDVSWLDVSCAAGSFCVAVGYYYDDNAGQQNISATTLNPAAANPTWTPRTLPISSDGNVYGVSCPSTSLCVITASPEYQGTTILTSTNPTATTPTWSSASLPGSDYNSYWGETLDCPSADFCVATGGRYNDEWVAYSTSPASGGSTWTTKGLSIDRLSTVACSSASSCVIGGSTYGDESNDWVDLPTIGFSANLTAASPTWSLFQPPGIKADWDYGVRGLSCTVSGACVGTTSYGQVASSTNPAGGGATWNVHDVATYNPPAALTCPSATFCALSDFDGHFAVTTTPEDSGNPWQVSPAPAEFEWGGEIRCFTESFCAGRGGSDSGEFFAVTGNPTSVTPTWSVVPFSAVENPGYFSCASASVCVVTGETYSGGEEIKKIAVTTNASAAEPSWSVTTIPSDLSFYEFSCVGDFCSAVGYKKIAEDDWDAAMVTVTGITGGTPNWKSTLVPGFSGGKEIVCHSTAFCMAIGQIYNEPLSNDGYEHYTQVFASSTNPTAANPTWHVGDIDMLDAASDTYPDDNGLFALSCPSDDRCVAVGSSYSDASNSWVPAMASTDNASSAAPTWTADSMPQTFNRLACPTADLCLAADSIGKVSIGMTGGPTVSISAPADGVVLADSPTQLSFSATGDAPLTMACRIDSGAYAACSSPFALPALPDGVHILTVRATDGAGKLKSESVLFNVDSTAPVVQITSPTGGSTLTSSSAELDFYVIDKTATTKTCKLDAGAAVSCNSSFALTGLSSGTHTVTVTATDMAGNVGATSVTFSVSLGGDQPGGGSNQPAPTAPAAPAPAPASAPGLLNTVGSMKPSGKAAFSVSCPAGCTLTATVTVGKKKYALPPVTIAAGATSATVKISKSVQKKIAAAKRKAKKSKKKLKVVLTTTATSVGGTSAPVAVKVKP